MDSWRAVNTSQKRIAERSNYAEDFPFGAEQFENFRFDFNFDDNFFENFQGPQPSAGPG